MKSQQDPRTTIETERLRLRDWREADKEPFHLHCNTPAVMRWLGGVQPREKYDEVVDRLAGWQAAHGHTFWAVERKPDGALLGFCGLKIADGASEPLQGELEIGWRLREDAWGQGYAREAATASLEYGFATLSASRMIALTVEGNAASRGLMLRLGMRRRADLDYEDPKWPAGMNPVIVHEILAQEWRR
jgi:RimJ/RimL family protein N-acetyltransferase